MGTLERKSGDTNVGDLKNNHFSVFPGIPGSTIALHYVDLRDKMKPYIPSRWWYSQLETMHYLWGTENQSTKLEAYLSYTRRRTLGNGD